MSKTIATEEMVIQLRAAGFSEEQAKSALKIVLSTVRTALLDNNRVNLTGICTLSGNHRASTIKKVVGSKHKVRATISVSVKTSRALVEDYRNTKVVEESVSEVRAAGNLFKK